jgi:hypothetical protein
MDRTTKEELLGFAGVVYSFLYFSVGHFPSLGALVSFDIILMISLFEGNNIFVYCV